MEQLLVCQALDERDFLEKKITDLINKMNYIVVVREKDTAYKGKPINTLEDQIKSDWQSVTDQIDRYERICRAITLSNASTKIKFKDGREMTVAEAITLKNAAKTGSDLRGMLSYNAIRAFNDAMIKEQEIERTQNSRREDYINTQLSNQSGDKNVSNEFIEAIGHLMAPYNAKVIDPIGISDKIDKIEAESEAFKAEVETLIKISNATTMIEF